MVVVSPPTGTRKHADQPSRGQPLCNFTTMSGPSKGTIQIYPVRLDGKCVNTLVQQHRTVGKYSTHSQNPNASKQAFIFSGNWEINSQADNSPTFFYLWVKYRSICKKLQVLFSNQASKKSIRMNQNPTFSPYASALFTFFTKNYRNFFCHPIF